MSDDVLPLDSQRSSSQLMNGNGENDGTPQHFNDEEGNIQGPMLFQMSAMYLFFIGLAGSAEVLGWAPDIRVFSIVPYGFMSFMSVEISRLLYKAYPYSIIPYYTTIPPFAAVCFLSREAHLLVAVFYFCAVCLVFMQCGNPRLRIHIWVYTLVFMGVYSTTVYFMSWFYTDNSDDATFRGKTLGQPINWGEEGTFLFALLLLGAALVMLEKFIQAYAKSLVDRANTVSNLLLANNALQRELYRYKKTKLDFDSPMSRAITILQEIGRQVPEELNEQLEQIITILSSNSLYEPRALKDASVDAEMQLYLKSMLSQGKTTDPRAGQNRRTTSGTALRDEAPAKMLSNTFSVQEAFEMIDKWDFDMFALGQMTHGRPLYFTSYALFHKYDLIKTFNIDENVLSKFLSKMEEGYLASNPYHNSIHAADVVQTMNVFLRECGLGKVLGDLDILSALLSCIIHDYNHPGLNNNFLVETRAPLAVLYNDTSVLEHHHCAASFSILYMEEYNILAGLNKDEHKEVRETTLQMVLATDMKSHFDIIGQFQAKLVGASGINPSERKDRQLLLKMAIKCADVSNPAKSGALCTRWADLIMEEFYRQGDKEKQLNIPVSTFYDRDTTKIERVQTGFIDFFVLPLYSALAKYPNIDLKRPVESLTVNRAYWESLQNPPGDPRAPSPTPIPSPQSPSSPVQTAATPKAAAKRAPPARSTSRLSTGSAGIGGGAKRT